jgi:hypothetical protein
VQQVLLAQSVQLAILDRQGQLARQGHKGFKAMWVPLAQSVQLDL